MNGKDNIPRNSSLRQVTLIPLIFLIENISELNDYIHSVEFDTQYDLLNEIQQLIDNYNKCQSIYYNKREPFSNQTLHSSLAISNTPKANISVDPIFNINSFMNELHNYSISNAFRYTLSESNPSESSECCFSHVLFKESQDNQNKGSSYSFIKAVDASALPKFSIREESEIAEQDCNEYALLSVLNPRDHLDYLIKAEVSSGQEFTINLSSLKDPSTSNENDSYKLISVIYFNKTTDHFCSFCKKGEWMMMYDDQLTPQRSHNFIKNNFKPKIILCRKISRNNSLTSRELKQEDQERPLLEDSIKNSELNQEENVKEAEDHITEIPSTIINAHEFIQEKNEREGEDHLTGISNLVKYSESKQQENDQKKKDDNSITVNTFENRISLNPQIENDQTNNDRRPLTALKAITPNLFTNNTRNNRKRLKPLGHSFFLLTDQGKLTSAKKAVDSNTSIISPNTRKVQSAKVKLNPLPRQYFNCALKYYDEKVKEYKDSIITKNQVRDSIQQPIIQLHCPKPPNNPVIKYYSIKHIIKEKPNGSKPGYFNQLARNNNIRNTPLSKKNDNQLGGGKKDCALTIEKTANKALPSKLKINSNPKGAQKFQLVHKPYL